MGSIRFLFYFPRIVFVLCLLCFSFCFVFGGRTHILKAGLWTLSFWVFTFYLIFMLPPHPQTHTHTHTHTHAEADLQTNALSCWCVLRAHFHFLGSVKGLPGLLGFSASAAARGGLLNSGACGAVASIPRAADTRARVRAPERSELLGGPRVTQPGREAGTVGGYWDLERRERTAAACVPGLLFGRTKYVESPHKLRTPCSETGLLRLALARRHFLNYPDSSLGPK